MLHGGLDTFQDDAGVGAGFVPDTSIECVATAGADLGALQQSVAAGVAHQFGLALQPGDQEALNWYSIGPEPQQSPET